MPRPFVPPIPSSEITPRRVYLQRRTWLAGAGALALPAWGQAGNKLPGSKSTVPGALALDKPTAQRDATTYNNFYEFGTDTSDPAENAHTLRTRPWTVSVEGECLKPRTFGIEELLKLAPMEERIYRLRCVEGWSMVIPWVGYPLSELIRRAEPTAKARYVEFTTLLDPKQMPGQRAA
ncbi:MAG: molybdopterin-dependent oxidoreductase, partial [Inhella sp.]